MIAPWKAYSAESDRVSPVSINKENVKRYRRSKAITEYRELAGRSHFMAGQPGWEEIADAALDWAVEHAVAVAPVPEDAPVTAAVPAAP